MGNQRQAGHSAGDVSINSATLRLVGMHKADVALRLRPSEKLPHDKTALVLWLQHKPGNEAASGALYGDGN